MIVKTEAIVLNSFKYGESSKIITLYTKDFGKIKVIAKGARKAKNKFGSSLDPLSYCQICFYKKPSTELYLLSDAEHVVPLRKIQDSYYHLSAGLIIAEAINITQDVNEVNQELFALSTKVLKFLNEIPKSPFSVSSYFLIKLSENIGFAIDFQSHPEGLADTELADRDKLFFKKIYFSIERGSFAQISKENNILSVETNIALALFKISNLPLDKVGELMLDRNSILQINDFFNVYFSYHLDRKNSFKTMNLFKTIL
ncbi:MAG: DNA repair protein RecO [bacterium]